MINPTVSGKPVCRACGFSGSHWLGDHLLEVHDLTADAYLKIFPDAPTVSAELSADLKVKAAAKITAARMDRPSVTFSGVTFSVNLDVPADECLPLPEAYRFPEHGNLAGDVQDALVAIKAGRSLWISGPPGTGKDAVISALSNKTRTPGKLFTVVQGADLQSWRFTRGFGANGETCWEEGDLLTSLRDGYLTKSGRRVPYIIVLSDIDRATRQQAEELRQIMDSILGRVSGPTGETYPVLKGTIIIATANSTGGGDTSGRCISANPVDASIMDRFERKVKFHHMHADDETPIVEGKFPTLAAKHPGAIPTIIKITGLIRDAVDKEMVFAEWSHRVVCAWAGAAQDLMTVLGSTLPTGPLLKRASRMVLDGLPNEDTRLAVSTIMDPHVKGGVIAEGTSPNRVGSLSA